MLRCHFAKACLLLAFAVLPIMRIAVAADATITVDNSRVLGKVPSYVFGQNVEAADSYRIFGDNHGYSSRDGSGLWNPNTAAPVPEAVTLSKDVNMTMLRYPGGCLAHNFNWKDAVGPIASRPNFAFGVDEFIAFCRTVNAEPLFTISDYYGTAQEAAELVEYLNAPADTKHPWAQKRALWGHPAPYHIRYFELGNETYHGNHNGVPSQKWTGTAYAQWFNEYAKLMRAVDPTIQIGAVMSPAIIGGTYNDPWDSGVLQGAGKNADFIIAHFYSIGWGSDTFPPSITTEKLMQACMAAVDQFEVKLAEHHKLIKQYVGKDLPLAITEYNAWFAQEKPVPFRFSYGGALFAADFVRVMLKPESNVLMANYWQFNNGYWGMVQLRNDATKQQVMTKKMPAYYLFRLWGQHFGQQLVSADVQSPRVEFKDGVLRTLPAIGDKYQPSAVVPGAPNYLDGVKMMTDTTTPGCSTEVRPDGTLVAKFENITGEKYLSICNVKAPPADCGYLLSFDGRATGNFPGQFGLGMQDARGWSATKSAIAAEGIEGAKGEWKHFEQRFATLKDCPGASLIWRLRPGDTPATGMVEVRNVKIIPMYNEHFPAYSALTASASRSTDGKKLYLIVFNKDGVNDVTTDILIKGIQATTARRWTVTGPSFDAINLKEELVKETESAISTPIQQGKITYTFPARSMTAFEIN
ncbi:MAG TPA: alpha-L-arabinofuranosidase C-terminal domain-containing protein [Armatimonadota bacterium]|nr:alpha-L-arabinofuranosidase C-terminal domain-containing protein [Armatimonadota bacterium]